MFKVYQKYLVIKFLQKFLLVSVVFLTLAIILGLLEELSFFKDSNHSPLYPYLLTLLNAPITVFEIFPFIFIITTLFFFSDIFKSNELDLLKKNGLDNFKIIKILLFVSISIGFFNILLFYNMSSVFKFHYSTIKNNLSNDNKYLAMVTDSGLWIKDEINNKKLIIKSNYLNDNFLSNTIINVFDNDFRLLRTIQSKKIDIKSNYWVLFNPEITVNNITEKKEKEIFFTNFNEERIKNLFSDISTLNLVKLFELKKDYSKLGYSSDEIEIHLLKLFSMPFFYGILTILSSILIFNLSKVRSLFFHVIIGIFMSVIIYYINFIFSSLGNNGKLPTYLAIFFPYVIYTMISIIGMVNLNEK